MAASVALLGYGSSFQIQSASSPDVFTELQEVISITPPSATLDQIDVSHMTSPNRRREFISGMTDSGECSLEMNWVPGSASDDILFDLLSLGVGVSRLRAMRITYPNGVTDSFSGELTGYEPAVQVDDKMTITVTFKVTGDITRGAT